MKKGYQIFLYNSENERMYRPTEIFQTLTQNQLVLLNKHLIQKLTAPKIKFLHGCLGSTNVRKERIFLTNPFIQAPTTPAVLFLLTISFSH